MSSSAKLREELIVKPALFMSLYIMFVGAFGEAFDQTVWTYTIIFLIVEVPYLVKIVIKRRQRTETKEVPPCYFRDSHGKVLHGKIEFDPNIHVVCGVTTDTNGEITGRIIELK